MVCTLLSRDLWEQRLSVSRSGRDVSVLVLQEAGDVHMFQSG